MTNEVNITHTDWSLISLPTNGSINNLGERDVYLRESTGKPSSAEENGFILFPGNSIPFIYSNSVKVWGRSNIADSKVYLSAVLNVRNSESSSSLSILDKLEKIIIELRINNKFNELGHDEIIDEDSIHEDRRR